MLKDTKSLGNNKAPACESRGFVRKKGGVHFDTPPGIRKRGRASQCILSLTGIMLLTILDKTRLYFT